MQCSCLPWVLRGMGLKWIAQGSVGACHSHCSHRVAGVPCLNLPASAEAPVSLHVAAPLAAPWQGFQLVQDMAVGQPVACHWQA